MYSAIHNGTKIDIQGLICNLPPEGYVFNALTKQLEYRGVYSRSDNPTEQYWERFQYPSWYKEVTKREDEYLKKKKDGDEPFYDAKYEEYKKQEWDRRLNGFWFWKSRYFNMNAPIDRLNSLRENNQGTYYRTIHEYSK